MFWQYIKKIFSLSLKQRGKEDLWTGDDSSNLTIERLASISDEKLPVNKLKEDMPDFIIKSSTYFPAIQFKAASDYFIVFGESHHSYAPEFFKPLLEYVKGYLKYKPTKVRFEFWYTYFNTTTSKRNLEIIESLDQYQGLNMEAEVNVYWYHLDNDSDMKQFGEEYSEGLNHIDLQIIELDEGQYYRMTKGFE